MRIVHSFLRLSFEDKYILIKALFLLWIVRIMLLVLPFSVIQRITGKFTVTSDEKDRSHNISIKKLTWAVKVMSRYTPKATCLTRALTAQILLAGQNYKSNIKIGVSKNNSNQLEAHAWLESDNRIVLGESETEYTLILNIGEETQ